MSTIPKLNEIWKIRILFVGLCIVFSTMALYQYNLNVYGDTSEYLDTSARILQKDLPYQDFWLLHPPGEVYLPAAISLISGSRVNTVLFVSSLISIIIGLMVFRLLLNITGNKWLALAAAALVFFDGVIYHRSYKYNHMYFLLILASLFPLIKKIKEQKLGVHLIIPGFIMGAALAFRFYETGAAIAAVLVALAIYGYHEHLSTYQTSRSLGFFSAGIAAVLLILICLCIPFLQPMINETLFESVGHSLSRFDLYFAAPFRYMKLTPGIIHAAVAHHTLTGYLDSIYSFVLMIYFWLFFLVPILIIALTPFCLKRRKDPILDTIILIFYLWGLFTFLRGITRPLAWQLSAAVSPLYIVMLLLVHRLRRYQIFSPKIQKALKNSLTALVLFICTVTVLRASRQFGQYLFKPVSDVKTPSGHLIFTDDKTASDFQAVLDYLLANTNETDFIFTTLQLPPAFYAMSGRQNPVYYDSLIDPFIRPDPEKENRIIRELTENKVRIIIHYADYKKTETGFAQILPRLDQFINEHYKKTEEYGQYAVYILDQRPNK